eukprot:403371068
MMNKYTNSKPITVQSDNSRQASQQQLQANQKQPLSLQINTEQSNKSTIHNIGREDQIVNAGSSSDQRQTPKSDRKPEININYHKIRQSSKNMKFETTNPFINKENENKPGELENQSPEKTQQHHYFTASFQNNNNSCLPDCSGSKGKQYSSNFQNEHVCDEDCLHEEEEYLRRSITKSGRHSQKCSTGRYSSPDKSPHQITQNLRVTSMSRTPKETNKSASKHPINSLNAKLISAKNDQNHFSGLTPNKSQSNNNQSTNLGMGFHTTSSKQLNLSNNYTLSSMQVNPFVQDDSINEEDGMDGSTLLYGSIKNSMGNMNSNPKARVERSFIQRQTHQSNKQQMNVTTKSVERSQSNNSSQRNSPNKNFKRDNLYQDKIEKIQKLQQKVLRKTQIENTSAKKQLMNITENKSQSNTPRFEKTKLQSRHQDIQDEDLIDTVDDYVETDPVNQLEHEIQGQPAGNYFSQEQNYINSHYISDQQQLLQLNSEQLNEKMGLKLRQNFQTGQNQSLYSTQSGFFNKQQDDQYLGTLNNFVDAKIQTLHVLIQEKRKLQLMMEEKQNSLKVLKQDRLNQLKQEEINKKELNLCQQRQITLKEQNKDLDLQIELVSEKIIEKSEEYQTQFGDLEHTLCKQRKTYQELESQYNFEIHKHTEIKLQRIKEIEHLKECNKEADGMYRELRGDTDHKSTEEKNRVQFMRDKGNDVLKVIQDDKVYSEKSVQKDRDRSQNNMHRFNKTPKGKYQDGQLEITHQSIVKDEFRSTSQIGLRQAQKQQISQQLQTYMQQKVNKNKNYNISCISITQANDSTLYNQNASMSNFNQSKTTLRDKSPNFYQRDKSLTQSRKDSDQVLSSSKSSKDLGKNQPNISRVKEEVKEQYFDKQAKKSQNFHSKSPINSKSSVKLHSNQESSRDQQMEVKQVKSTRNNMPKQQQGYQSQETSQIAKHNKKLTSKGEIQATYATVNLF